MRSRQRPATPPAPDAAVSPVIGVVLMVSITVVLAATVYMWVSNLQHSEHPEGVHDITIRATTVDKDGDGRQDAIKVLLLTGSDMPLRDDLGATFDEVLVTVDSAGATRTEANGGLCTGMPEEWGFGPCFAGEVFAADTTTWEPGEALFAQCSGAVPHAVAVAVRGFAVFQAEVRCEEPTP